MDSNNKIYTPLKFWFQNPILALSMISIDSLTESIIKNDITRVTYIELMNYIKIHYINKIILDFLSDENIE